MRHRTYGTIPAVAMSVSRSIPGNVATLSNRKVFIQAALPGMTPGSQRRDWHVANDPVEDSLASRQPWEDIDSIQG